MDKKRADEFPSEQAAKRIVVTLRRPADPMAALQQVLKIVPYAWIQEGCANSVAALRLTCTQLQLVWNQRWQAAYSSWASHGAFPELDRFPYRATRYLGARFMQPVGRGARCMAATSLFQLEEFVQKSCFAIEVDAIAMLAKYHAAHRSANAFAAPSEAKRSALTRLLAAALQRDSPCALAVVLSSAVLLFGERATLPPLGRTDAFPRECFEYLLNVTQAQMAATAHDGLLISECGALDAEWHKHTLRLLPFGLPTLCEHKRLLPVTNDEYAAKSTVKCWNFDALCYWLVTACPLAHYLEAVDFVLRLAAIVPRLRCTRPRLLFWLLEQAPARLIERLRRNERIDGADLLTRPHLEALLQSSTKHERRLRFLWCQDKFNNAKHLDLVRWFLAARPCQFVPHIWELQLILTDPLLSDAAKQQHISKRALLDALPSPQLTAAIPIGTLVRYSASASHHAEYLLVFCDSWVASSKSPEALSSERRLEALAEADSLCREPTKRLEVIKWINAYPAAPPESQTPFALRMLRGLLPLRPGVDAERLCRVLEFLADC